MLLPRLVTVKQPKEKGLKEGDAGKQEEEEEEEAVVERRYVICSRAWDKRLPSLPSLPPSLPPFSDPERKPNPWLWL